MSKKVIMLVLAGFVLIGLLGCPVTNAPFVPGSFTLTIHSENTGRTILPDVGGSISSYLVEFSGSSPVVPVSTTSSTVTIDLPVGTWNITVEGRDASDNVVATGVVNGVVITNGGHVDESVSLSPLSAGNGSVNVTISWPAGQTIDDASTVEFDGTTYGTSASELTFNGTERILVFQISSVASGNHTFFAYLKDADTLKTTVSESVQVYDNLSSSANIDLTENDFTQAPPASTLLSPVEGNGQILLTWENTSKVITGYRVERSLLEGSGFSEIGTTDGITLTYTDTTVVSGTLYYYRISASSTGGTSISNTVNLASAPPVPGDSGTIGFSDTTATSTILSWTKAADNVSAESTLEYRVVQSESNNIDTASNAESNGTQVQDWTADIDTCSAEGLSAGTTYYFNVLVRDEAGNTDVYTMNSITPEEGQVTLTITVTEPDDKTITFSESDDITVTQQSTLTIAVSETFDSYEWYLDGTLIDGEAAAAIDYDCSGTSLGVHHLAVFVTEGSWIYSRTIRFIVVNLYPPDNLAASVISASQIDLTWADNSDDEDGFKIERSPDGSSFTQIDTVGANVTSYSDAGLSADTLYYYQVRAYNAAGDSSYSNTVNATTDTSPAVLIIDHTAIAQFDNIPQGYIDEAKKRLLILPGESHGRAYGYGLELVENADSRFDASTNWSGAAESYTDSNLRWNRSFLDNTTWNNSCGEEDFYTNAAARTDTLTGLQTIDSTYTGTIYFGFGWCWDMSWLNGITSTKDAVYKCGWAGSSADGPDGNLAWGLDSDDQSITGNSVSLQTYLDAVDYYNTNAPGIKTIFTTGPVDTEQNTEAGYQRSIKQDKIREYVQTHGGILFDYADILSWDYTNGLRIDESWTDGDTTVHHWNGVYPAFTWIEYDGGYGSCHISEDAVVLIGKALWVMLARDAGWDGN